MSQFCTNCGAPMPEDANFCEACGTGRTSDSTGSDHGSPHVEAVSTGSGDTGRRASRIGKSGHIFKMALIGGAVIFIIVLGILLVPALKNRGERKTEAERAKSSLQEDNPDVGMEVRPDSIALSNPRIPEGYRVKNEAGRRKRQTPLHPDG